MKKALILLIVLSSCYSIEFVEFLNDKNSKDLLGSRISIIGTAINTKLGARLLVNDSTSIYIHNLDSWPKEFYSGGDKGKVLKVTGKLIERHDLPVYVQKSGEPIRAGIAVPEGTDLKKASHRFLLKKASWELLEE